MHSKNIYGCLACLLSPYVIFLCLSCFLSGQLARAAVFQEVKVCQFFLKASIYIFSLIPRSS